MNGVAGPLRARLHGRGHYGPMLSIQFAQGDEDGRNCVEFTVARRAARGGRG